MITNPKDFNFVPVNIQSCIFETYLLRHFLLQKVNCPELMLLKESSDVFMYKRR